jgi:hypothetical protein
MKFRVTKNSDGKPVEFVIRVDRPVPRQQWNGPTGCHCGEVYPVVMKSIELDHLKQGAHYDGQKFVCNCHGEVIHGGTR